jgi:protein MAK16
MSDAENESDNIENEEGDNEQDDNEEEDDDEEEECDEDEEDEKLAKKDGKTFHTKKKLSDEISNQTFFRLQRDPNCKILQAFIFSDCRSGIE